MAKYRKKGQIDVYQKEKSNWGEVILGIVFVLFILGLIVQ